MNRDGDFWAPKLDYWFCRDKPALVIESTAEDAMKAMIEALREVIKRTHYLLEVLLTRARWYVVYPLRLKHIEEMMAGRGVFGDDATIHRWALKIEPALMRVFRDRRRPVGRSWRTDAAEADALTFTTFPREHRAKIHSINPL